MPVQDRNRQRGFTLIELVIVIAIVLILAGFAVMQTKSTTNNSKANAAMGNVVTQLRQARQMAITMRRNVLVTFTAPNQMQLAVQTLPGEAPATVLKPVLLNDGAPGGLQFYVFPTIPDTPMNFGKSQAINFVTSTGGTSGLSVLFSTSGSFVGTTATTNFAAVGNNNQVNASIFVGIPGTPNSARAITVLGGTGRVRSFYWDGTNWNE
jgi:prepilin-type N-terminal cleavage/methylation domain-containing protein